MHLINAETCAEAWEKSIRLLLEAAGVERYLSAEGPCWEIANMVLAVRRPLDEPRVSSAYDFRADVLDYTTDLMLRANQGVESVYDRLYRWKVGRSKLDQLESVVKTLRQDPTSRRGVVAIWDPAIDARGAYPMCSLGMTFRLRPTGLDLTVVVRSNDAWFAAPADIKGFTDLQKIVADELMTPIGHYVHHSVSYHIYDYDVPRATALLGTRQHDLFPK